MVDPYAIVRRLTGHELISPKDARLLTEAIDGLIDEIGSKDARIAELEAENDRLRKALEPFADIDGEPWADESGWTDAACQNDRICDWFGPSAFLAARRALKGGTDHG